MNQENINIAARGSNRPRGGNLIKHPENIAESDNEKRGNR